MRVFFVCVHVCVYKCRLHCRLLSVDLLCVGLYGLFVSAFFLSVLLGAQCLCAVSVYAYVPFVCVLVCVFISVYF